MSSISKSVQTGGSSQSKLESVQAVDASESEDWRVGTVVSLDREKFEGLVRLDEDAKKRTLLFDQSMISLDERYMGEVIVGAQFVCEVETDKTGELKLKSLYPRDTMSFSGTISGIRRSEGVVEVTPELLATTVEFSRAHLDRPDDFSRIRVGDKVQVEMEFYNLIAKRKPPRATRVFLSKDTQESEHRLRPALRRSSSMSGRVSSSESEHYDDYAASRPRSLSQSRSLDEDEFPIIGGRRGYRTPDADSEFGSSGLYNRQNRPMYMPPVPPGYPLHAHGHFNPMPPPAGWMLRQYNNIPPGCMAPGMQGVPYAHAYPRPPTFHPSASLPDRGSWAPPKPPNYRDDFERPDKDRERELSRRELLSSVLNRPVGSLRHQVDDSEVVIEVTIDELRRLMLERPRSRSRENDQ